MLLVIFLILLNVVYFLMTRIAYLVYQVIFETRAKEVQREDSDKVKTLIVIGSGGHTTEMVQLVDALDKDRYCPRSYVVAKTDTWSSQKIDTFEKDGHPENEELPYEIIQIPRSREVFQSFFSTVFTTLHSIFYSLPIVFRIKPDLILCNGPGTCIPICFIAFMMRVFFISNNRIIFVESICRVKSMSLTGKILLFIADEVLVQWPDLQELYPRAKYIGRL